MATKLEKDRLAWALWKSRKQNRQRRKGGNENNATLCGQTVTLGGETVTIQGA